MIISKEIAEEVDRYRYWTGSTHAGHPIVGASVAAAVEFMLKVIISERCVLNGVMVGSNVPNAIRVAPPLTIKDEEIEFGFEVIDKVLTEIDEMCD